MKPAFLFVGLTCGFLAAAGIDSGALKMFAPLPAVIESAENPITEAKVRLGRMLYYEPRLSKSQEVACNNCHLLDKYGVDNQPVSEGHKGLKGNRNAPTVYNAAGHVAQFWDGRAPDVEEQAKGPVMNPVEMAMPSSAQVLAVLKSIPEYPAAFKEAFPGEADPVTFDNLGRAIAAFERKLVTPSPWDRFLRGDRGALTAAQLRGFDKFVAAGCAACHNGAYVGGGSFQKLGLVKPWTKDADPGRFAVTKNEGDRRSFKVPSLRNIEKTGPYFHDGSVPALGQAVSLMAEYQGGRTLPPADVEAIVAWLRTLTGQIPAEYIRKPALPRSTAATPKPDPT
jgi:cytochrome c peroxidase